MFALQNYQTFQSFRFSNELQSSTAARHMRPMIEACVGNREIAKETRDAKENHILSDFCIFQIVALFCIFVVYDDNGGFFDHVPTPLYAPPPNAPCDKLNTGCPDTFAFDRLGPRLANLLISPRVPKGAVFRDPAMRPGQSKAR